MTSTNPRTQRIHACTKAKSRPVGSNAEVRVWAYILKSKQMKRYGIKTVTIFDWLNIYAGGGKLPLPPPPPPVPVSLNNG
jgi:hypothetical protein